MSKFAGSGSNLSFVSHSGRMIVKDVNESQLLRLIEGKVKMVILPIRGQGFIFGRGNQQISPEIIRKVGKPT